MLLIKNLSFGYDDDKIIDGFSYQFEKWKIYGIFWKSWLWKSTLARVMWWFLQSFEWDISLDQKKVISPSKDIMYMSQKDDIFYRLTAYDNLYLLCHDKEKVDYALKAVGLYNCDDKLPKKLSWWMIKRLAFARILLLKPKILILDEPFVHLDIKAKEKLINLLLDMHNINRYMTIILISHNINEMKIADTILSFVGSINSIYREDDN